MNMVESLLLEEQVKITVSAAVPEQLHSLDGSSSIKLLALGDLEALHVYITLAPRYTNTSSGERACWPELAFAA